LAEACFAGEGGRALEHVGELIARGGDIHALLFDLLAYLRSLLVVKLTARGGEILGLSPETVAELDQRGRHVEIPHVELALRFLLEAEGEMRRGPHPRYVLEMALVRVAEARGLQSLGSLVKRLESLEDRLGGVSEPGPQPGLFPVEGKSDPPAPPAPATALVARWDEVRRLIGVERRSLAVLLDEAEVALEGDTLILTFANGNQFARSTLEDPEVWNLLASRVSEAFGRRLQVNYRFLPPAGGRPDQGASPVSARDHPVVREAIEMFRGRIVEVEEGKDVTPR
ncbi:MAG: hypothetical protein ACE5G5_08405, partial [Candidatus Methylomirabilales bacterium]